MRRALALAILIVVSSLARVHAQNPPAVLYGPGIPGDRVDALIGGRTCGSTTVESDGYWLLLVPEGGVCGAKDGDTVGFRLNGQPAVPGEVWKPGGTPFDQSRGIVLSVASAPPVLALPVPPSAAPQPAMPTQPIPTAPSPATSSNPAKAPIAPSAPISVGLATPLAPPVASVIVNSGGDGVSERFNCEPEARRTAGVAEGAAVTITFVGVGPCEGWFVVDAGGRTSWVDGRFLVPASIDEARAQRDATSSAVAALPTPAPITEVRIVSRLRWYERLAQNVEPAGLLLLVGVFSVVALMLLPQRNRWP